MNKSKPEVYIHGIATGVPENHYTQKFALDFLLKLQGASPTKREFLQKVYSDTGIEKRHSVIADYGLAPEDYTFFPQNEEMEPQPETRERNDLYITEANKLAASCGEKLLNKLSHVDKQEITHLVTVSCTGFSVPGFDIHIVKELGLSTGINRCHVGFMGCYAAFPALRAARDICAGNPDAKVLVVAVEICSIHLQKRFSPENVVAGAIFADGAAAALVSSSEQDSTGTSLSMNSFNSEIIEDSEEDMAWKIGSHGFDMRLSLYVPKLIGSNIRAVVDQTLEASGMEPEDIDTWAIHPGGRAILEKVEQELSFGKDKLSPSYEVLNDFGNMSSATILFVLKKILEREGNRNIFAAAFGPGLTVESGLMKKVAVC